MKKMMLMTLLFVGITSIASYGQVNKADIEAGITAVGGNSKFTGIFVSNVKTLYKDGSYNREWYDLKYENTGYELKESAFMIKTYTDNSKAKVESVIFIVYTSIDRITMSETGINIYVKD